MAKEQDLALTQQLTQHLKGSQAGVAPGSALAADDASKTSTYLVLLYMALGQHEEAAEVAVGLARRAQDAGNYKVRGPKTACSVMIFHQSAKFVDAALHCLIFNFVVPCTTNSSAFHCAIGSCPDWEGARGCRH